MENDLLRPRDLEQLWNLSPRQTRNIMTELERLGFILTAHYRGARQLPRPVAEAVRATRQAGTELASLTARSDMRVYVRSDLAPVQHELVDTLELRTELSIMREVIGALHHSLSSGSQRLGYAAPLSWDWLGVPDPRRGL